MKLYLSLAGRIGAKPYGSDNNLVAISNHVAKINREVWDLLHQDLKPLRTFLQIICVVALQFMIVEVRSHIPHNGLSISTAHRFEVTLYELPVYARLIHVPSLICSKISRQNVREKSKTRGFRSPMFLLRFATVLRHQCDSGNAMAEPNTKMLS
jgi:hypothetical protein